VDIQTPAQVPASGNCLYGTVLGDGCPGNGGAYLQQDLFSIYGKQNGQTYGNSGAGILCSGANCHSSHNVAGVDYGIGITTPVSSHVDPVLNPPAGCNTRFVGPNGYYNVVQLTDPGSFTGKTFGASIGGFAVDMVHGSFTGVTIMNNFVDPTGLLFSPVIFSVNSATCSSPAIVTGNVNMLNGETINSYSGGRSNGC